MHLVTLGLVAMMSANPNAPHVAVTIGVAGTVADDRDVTLSAVPLDGTSGDARAAVQVKGSVRGRTTMRLLPGRWLLTATADGLWCVPLELEVVGATEVAMRAWPAAQLRGSFDRRLVRHDPPPARLEASVEILGFGVAGRFVATETCDVSGDAWVCNVPAARLVVRFQAQGYAPRYIHDIEPSLTPLQVSPLLLERGASVVGVVVDAQTQRPELTARVALCAPNGDRLGRVPAAGVDRSGRFQIVVPDPGSYVLCAGAKTGRTAASEPMQIGASDDLRLSEPLALRQPLTLRLAIHPPVDPGGLRWRADLHRVQGVEGRIVVQGAMVGEDGSWTRGGLAEGHYVLRLFTTSGAVWASKRIDLSIDAQDVEVDVRTCLLSGNVRLGDEPLAARVFFGGDRGPLSIVFDSDDTGDFGGDIPCGEDLTTRAWKFVVESNGVRRVAHAVRLVEGGGAFRAAIRFNDSTVEVDVVDDVGKAVEDATITVVDADQPERMQQVGAREYKSEDDSRGRVLIHGLDAGSYLIEAKAGLASTSEPVRFEVGRQSRRQSLRVVVRRQVEVSGMVLTEEGSPIPFATIRLVPTQGVFPITREVQSDTLGRFVFRLPSGTREVALLAHAYGRSLRLSRVSTASREPLVVRLAPTGGTLLLKHDEPLISDVGTYVLREGAFVDAMTLKHWAATHGQPQTDDVLAVPQMEPGYYHACRVPAAEAAILFSGQVPPRCVGGYLTPGGSLTLGVPEAAPPPGS